ncbi:MAG: hypothetical protein LBN43_09935 [Oscillospiraceae bacterium]|nr:hypothetical protein [Oscillospiraceae bacterium]
MIRFYAISRILAAVFAVRMLAEYSALRISGALDIEDTALPLVFDLSDFVVRE